MPLLLLPPIPLLLLLDEDEPLLLFLRKSRSVTGSAVASSIEEAIKTAINTEERDNIIIIIVWKWHQTPHRLQTRTHKKCGRAVQLFLNCKSCAPHKLPMDDDRQILARNFVPNTALCAETKMIIEISMRENVVARRQWWHFKTRVGVNPSQSVPVFVHVLSCAFMFCHATDIFILNSLCATAQHLKT